MVHPLVPTYKNTKKFDSPMKKVDILFEGVNLPMVYRIILSTFETKLLFH